MDPAEVAARADHSIAVLYRFYAKILKGGQQQSNRLMPARWTRGDQPVAAGRSDNPQPIVE
ncbi:hypothetical protein ACIRP7_12025 [Streptomyces sp. NPDC102270]|uniref:hypothetical protein n=1 Tax=Streptomyces sp. NPDC102270 TaxID=3366150 RepID=UPI0037FE941B